MDQNDKLEGKIAAANKSLSPAQSLNAQAKAFFERQKDNLAALLGSHQEAQRLYVAVMYSVSKSPQLVSADPGSIFTSLMRCAELKLFPGPLGQAAIVPFWNKKKNCFEAQFMPQYQGLLDLAYRSGQVVPPTYAEIVWERDLFKFVKGDNPRIVHEPFAGSDDARGNRVGCYVVLNLRNGNQIRHYMTIEHVMRYQQQSKTAQAQNANTFWKSDNPDTVDWMIKKTVLKQALKLAPKSVDLAAAVDYDNEVDNPSSDKKPILDFDFSEQAAPEKDGGDK